VKFDEDTASWNLGESERDKHFVDDGFISNSKLLPNSHYSEFNLEQSEISTCAHYQFWVARNVADRARRKLFIASTS
jgi:hypothetical protein